MLVRRILSSQSPGTNRYNPMLVSGGDTGSAATKDKTVVAYEIGSPMDQLSLISCIGPKNVSYSWLGQVGGFGILQFGATDHRAWSLLTTLLCRHISRRLFRSSISKSTMRARACWPTSHSTLNSAFYTPIVSTRAVSVPSSASPLTTANRYKTPRRCLHLSGIGQSNST